MTNYLRNILTASALLVMFSTTFALGASVTFTTSASGDYQILGSNMDGVAGIQLNITYDSALLATPTVTQGGLVSGAMLAANTTQPGIIKIAIISTRAFSGSGQIATISFASKKAGGSILSITTNMIDSNGLTITSSSSNPSSEAASHGFITAPGVPFSQSTQQDSTSTTTTSTTTPSTTSIPTYLGTVSLPSDLLQRSDQQPAPSSTVPSKSGVGEPSVSNAAEHTKPLDDQISDSKVEETPQFIAYKGVLERFKLHNGKKDLATMVTLFAKNIVQTVHQEPAILLSDGQNKTTLTVNIPVKTSSSPNFAVNGGKLISFKQDTHNTGSWIIEVLPESGSIKTTLSIIAGAEDFEFPLTVAPPIKTALTLDDTGWNKFVKEVGTTKTPLHDLNNDGVRDYVDEFIFVANYLAKKTTPPKPVSTPNKTAE